MAQPTPAETPWAVTRIVLWPTRGGDIATTPLEEPLADANPEEARFFAEQYADVPLLELWRRLRRAEWDRDHYEREHRALQEAQRRMPPLHAIQEMDARHRRVRALLEAPGQRAIPRAELRAALTESTVSATRKEA